MIHKYDPSNKIFFIFLILTIPLYIFGDIYSVQPQKSNVVIAGTSSMHDWTMEGNGVKGQGELVFSNDELSGIKNLVVTMNATSLKSGKSGMDKKAYDALDTERYPNVTFTLNQIESISKKDTITTLTCKGVLTIKDVSKERKLTVTSMISPDGIITCKTSFPLKMTTFNVPPPKALLGMIKTGDDITVTINITFKKQ